MIPILKYGQDLSRIFSRSQLDMDNISQQVKAIIKDVLARGDEALFEYSEKFDKVKLNKDNILLTKEEIDEACSKVPSSTLLALKNAKKNIIEYHERQLRQQQFTDNNGALTGFIYRAVERAGIYVPGGKAAYPSSVLMSALPAVVAGVKDVVMVTPPGQFLNPLTIAAARECGVERVYRVGGAHSIAALAFGTESIPKVNVISGPGNIYVTLAKREVFGHVGIDIIAGPSEILIIADDTANAQFVAADMLSQAEHDELAMCVLITDSAALAENVLSEVEKQLDKLSKYDIAKKSLASFGSIVLVDNIQDAFDLSNKIAPEHLELCIKNSQEYLGLVKNAGAVFLGNYSPEPLGDYYAGTNHVLPTSGTAKFFSGLSVDNYLKRISVVSYTKQALNSVASDIILLAETECLDAHANSIKVRLE